MEEPGRLQSMGSLGVRHDWATSVPLFTFHFYALEKEMATHSSVLAWRIPGTGEPGGLHRVGHDWSNLAAAAAADRGSSFLLLVCGALVSWKCIDFCQVHFLRLLKLSHGFCLYSSNLVYCLCLCCHFSHVRLFETLWTLACQAPLCMGFSRQGVGCHFLLQGIFPTQGSNQHLSDIGRWALYD